MTKSVSAKMGIQAGMRSIFVNAPTEAIRTMDLPALNEQTSLTGEFDYIHLFARNQDDFREHFPKLKVHINPTGMLWVSWPKARQLGTDLSLPTVIEIGYEYGLVESKSLSINSVWSALKFTHPKPAKIYNNSYGKLPSHS